MVMAILLLIMDFYYFDKQLVIHHLRTTEKEDPRIINHEDDQTIVKNGSCNNFKPEIDPYEYGGQSSGRQTGGLLPDCAIIHFSTSIKLPIVALASVPGSGNTWVRHLIQQLTGKNIKT